MPPPVILDPTELDFDKLAITREEIQRSNPQRAEFALLDGIVHLDAEREVFAGFHDIHEDDWWTRGHIPGRPLFPGVLMIESAAQLVSYMSRHVLKVEGFLGFAAVDRAKFRGTLVPPARFVVVGRAVQVKKRRVVCETQGFTGDRMIFEAVITGMIV